MGFKVFLQLVQSVANGGEEANKAVVVQGTTARNDEGLRHKAGQVIPNTSPNGVAWQRTILDQGSEESEPIRSFDRVLSTRKKASNVVLKKELTAE